MSINVITWSSVRRRDLLIVFLVVVLLISSSLLFVYVFMMDSDGSVPLDNVNSVMNEKELRNALNNVQIGESAIITIDNDIILTGFALSIPANKNITLTSNNTTDFYKLTGVDDRSTLIVEAGGILRLDGVIVAHAIGDFGCGVQVMSGGTLVMYSGEISDNTGNAVRIGCGVRINSGGSFVMFGGSISNNMGNYGGGVYNNGVFEFFGGVISGNIAGFNGGGVYNEGSCSFTMSGGTIYNNISEASGGGVYNRGSFTMSGGTISNNTTNKGYGGGVYNNGNFNRSGGEISGNTANANENVYGTF
ncbi:MAG: hypothetical protein LBC03_00940 [Nitrososphaerota archaeon]|jgi:hypothetical protein|nr:hypothetical protein [Nitrososphaerota archaeon]